MEEKACMAHEEGLKLVVEESHDCCDWLLRVLLLLLSASTAVLGSVSKLEALIGDGINPTGASSIDLLLLCLMSLLLFHDSISMSLLAILL